jgi:uncharacterized membrane protein YjgN (DUF898 family)
MMSILIILLLLSIAVIGFLYVIWVHLTLKNEFKEKQWLDNSEFDYGHDVRYEHTDF